MATYKGVIVHRCDTNSSGMKYYAYTDKGVVKSDTLRGVKKLINFNNSKKRRK